MLPCDVYKDELTIENPKAGTETCIHIYIETNRLKADGEQLQRPVRKPKELHTVAVFKSCPEGVKSITTSLCIHSI